MRLDWVPGAVAGISCAILLALFSIQRFGTSRIATAFSPVLIAWFTVNAGVGIFNIARCDSKALFGFCTAIL